MARISAHRVFASLLQQSGDRRKRQPDRAEGSTRNLAREQLVDAHQSNARRNRDRFSLDRQFACRCVGRSLAAAADESP